MSFFVIHSLGTFRAPVSLTDNQNDTSLSLYIETCMKIYLWLHSPKVWCLKNIINLLLCSMVLELIEFSCGGGGGVPHLWSPMQLVWWWLVTVIWRLPSHMWPLCSDGWEHLELDRHVSHTASRVAGLGFLTVWWSQGDWMSQWQLTPSAVTISRKLGGICQLKTPTL